MKYYQPAFKLASCGAHASPPDFFNPLRRCLHMLVTLKVQKKHLPCRLTDCWFTCLLLCWYPHCWLIFLHLGFRQNHSLEANPSRALEHRCSMKGMKGFLSFGELVYVPEVCPNIKTSWNSQHCNKNSQQLRANSPCFASLGNGWDSSTKRHPRPAPAKHLRESVPKIDPKTV